jgi:VanZ family protein
VVYWLPVAVMMLLIFLASGSSASFSNSRHFFEPIIRWFVPDISEQGVRGVIAVVRKSAHVSEYGALSFLVWRALRKPRRNDPRPWTWKEPAIVLVGAAVYAITDEWHQSFVPNRQGAVYDVFIDLSGAVMAMALVWLLHRRRTKRSGAAESPLPSEPMRG